MSASPIWDEETILICLRMPASSPSSAATAVIITIPPGISHGRQPLHHCSQLGWMAKRFQNGGGFIAAVDHAVGAARVAASAILLPIGGFHQLFETSRVLISQQIAGRAPASHRVGGRTPGGAAVVPLAAQE